MKDQCVSLNSAEVLLRCRNTLETALFAAAAPPLPPESPILFRERDRQFESASLQRPVCLASAFHAYRRKDPAFARSVSLDVTRERDVLATSRLALAAFL